MTRSALLGWLVWLLLSADVSAGIIFESVFMRAYVRKGSTMSEQERIVTEYPGGLNRGGTGAGSSSELSAILYSAYYVGDNALGVNDSITTNLQTRATHVFDASVAEVSVIFSLDKYHAEPRLRQTSDWFFGSHPDLRIRNLDTGLIVWEQPGFDFFGFDTPNDYREVNLPAMPAGRYELSDVLGSSLVMGSRGYANSRAHFIVPEPSGLFLILPAFLFFFRRGW